MLRNLAIRCAVIRSWWRSQEPMNRHRLFVGWLQGGSRQSLLGRMGRAYSLVS
ncbi:MAG UNVERIFIED_CONTAM: hypothetical protein LVT10_07830 [Anaerolineae bacterium]